MRSSYSGPAMRAPRSVTPQLLSMTAGAPRCRPDRRPAFGGTASRPASHDAPAVTGLRRSHGPSSVFGVMQGILNVLLRVPRPSHVDTIQRRRMNVEGFVGEPKPTGPQSGGSNGVGMASGSGASRGNPVDRQGGADTGTKGRRAKPGTGWESPRREVQSAWGGGRRRRGRTLDNRRHGRHDSGRPLAPAHGECGNHRADRWDAQPCAGAGPRRPDRDGQRLGRVDRLADGHAGPSELPRRAERPVGRAERLRRAATVVAEPRVHGGSSSTTTRCRMRGFRASGARWAVM